MGLICPGYNSIKSQVTRTELFSKNKHIFFSDGTFYISPILSYQVFITRTYITELNCFYTTSFSILNNKNYETENRNYCDNIEHITNNASRSFSKYLKKFIFQKTNLFQLLSELQEEENLNIILTTKGELMEF
ncbi:hypothetical protein U3516DRAFT_849904 [Neocallimastix sp. 'constans']